MEKLWENWINLDDNGPKGGGIVVGFKSMIGVPEKLCVSDKISASVNEIVAIRISTLSLDAAQIDK